MVPKTHELAAFHKQPGFADLMENPKTREDLKEFDQLLLEQQKGTVFIGFHEGEFWKFKCSYKYKLGQVDKYRSVFPFLTLGAQGCMTETIFPKCEKGAFLDRPGIVRDVQ